MIFFINIVGRYYKLTIVVFMINFNAMTYYLIYVELIFLLYIRRLNNLKDHTNSKNQYSVVTYI